MPIATLTFHRVKRLGVSIIADHKYQHTSGKFAVRKLIIETHDSQEPFEILLFANLLSDLAVNLDDPIKTD